MANILEMTFQEKEELAESYDNQKLEYESVLATALTSFFISLGRDFTNVYSATGEIIDADEYLDDLTEVLTDSYNETSQYFSRHFERGLIAQTGSSNDELAERSAFLLLLLNGVRPTINLDIADYISSHTPRQAKEILRTTNKVLDTAVEQAKELILDSDVLEMDNSTISRTAGRLANEKNLNRIGTIKETEIGIAESESANYEATNMQKAINDNDLVFQVAKQWISELDSLVRPAHAKAHGQAREITQKFLVDSEYLQFPRDMVNGSLGNTINCRCQSIYT